MTTSCSSRERISKILLVALAGLACGGCFTGHLVERGRLHETLLRYDRAIEIGDELVIEYTAKQSFRPPVFDATAKPETGPLRTRSRAVAIPRHALVSDPPIAVDDFPLRRIPESQIGGDDSSARDIPLRRSAQTPYAQASHGRDVFEVEMDGARETGLRCCGPSEKTCSGRFYSKALYQTSLAWWVYPLFPLTVAIDVAVLPIHVITLPILVTTGD